MSRAECRAAAHRARLAEIEQLARDLRTPDVHDRSNAMANIATA
jgi:hypothetical protein